MAKISFFDFLNAINSKSNTCLDIGAYVPFMVNRGLSYHMDTVLFANEMNQRAATPDDMQYKFYLETVRKGKRFSKWAKPEADENLAAIMETFKCNRTRATEIEALLNTSQLNAVKELLSKGGR